MAASYDVWDKHHRRDSVCAPSKGRGLTSTGSEVPDECFQSAVLYLGSCLVFVFELKYRHSKIVLLNILSGSGPFC